MNLLALGRVEIEAEESRGIISMPMRVSMVELDVCCIVLLHSTLVNIARRFEKRGGSLPIF
jgi:hypothetical protein